MIFGGSGNSRGGSDDFSHMRCSDIREALSARLDGEDPGLAAGTLDAHLGTCAGCRDWSEAAGALGQVVRRASAHHVALDPALLAALTASGDERRPVRSTAGRWRVVLALVALGQVAVSWSGSVVRHGHAAAHLSHELASWDLGLAVGLLVAAAVPARAWGMLPLAAVLVACTVAASLVDLAAGHAVLGREVVHALGVAGLAALWGVARRAPRPAVVVRAS